MSILICFITVANGQSLERRGDWTVEGLLHSNATPTWEEAVEIATLLSMSDSRCTLHELGKGDIGRPIHALVLTAEPWDSERFPNPDVADRLAPSKGERVTVLVNNAIHPGEPCGVNASLALLMKWLAEPDGVDHPLRHANWVVIPQYNVGGAARRNCCTRANQNGPESYGFRGNAANLDLNRDFVKMDSRNAEAFVRLMHAVDPDVFVDTHTSNGADYPYTMTLITTQPDKAGPVLGPFLREIMEPDLMQRMKEHGWPTVPYVYSRGETPEGGIMGFLETPRYSTGYAVLFGTLGFTTEAHMLKPFENRVAATHAFLESLSELIEESGEQILEIRELERNRIREAQALPVRWALSNEVDSISFTGFSSRKEWSPISRSNRLRYDRSQIWTKNIAWANHYQAVDSVDIPTAWILPQAWRHVASRLEANGVKLQVLERDTSMYLDVMWVDRFRSSGPYEGHHPLAIDSVHSTRERIELYKGDFIIPSNQPAKRYLAEVFSPKAHDAFLVWNFFDAALQRKEYYSSYVFEETAEELLESDPLLRSKWEEAQRAHPEWDDQPGAALRWIYEASQYNEGTVNRYPVYCIPKSTLQ